MAQDILWTSRILYGIMTWAELNLDKTKTIRPLS